MDHRKIVFKTSGPKSRDNSRDEKSYKQRLESILLFRLFQDRWIDILTISNQKGCPKESCRLLLIEVLKVMKRDGL